MKKVITRGFSLVLLLVAAVSLVACGGGKKAKLEASYVSDPVVDFMSAYPAYTYKQATFKAQSIDIFSDGTYELTVTETHYSGELLFPNEGEHKVVPRGVTVTTYYGKYAAVEADGLKTLSLEKPTRIVKVNTITTAGSNYSVDTENWTDASGVAVGTEETPITAEKFLENNAFAKFDLLVNVATNAFEYNSLTK